MSGPINGNPKVASFDRELAQANRFRSFSFVLLPLVMLIADYSAVNSAISTRGSFQLLRPLFGSQISGSQIFSSQALSMLARQPAQLESKRYGAIFQPAGVDGRIPVFALQSEQILGFISQPLTHKTLALSSQGKIYEVSKTDTLSKTPILDLGRKIELFVSSTDGSLLAISNSNQVEVWSLSTLKRLALNNKVKARITSLVFQSDNKALLFGGADGRIYRWRFADRSEEFKESDRYIGSASVVSAVAFHPTGRLFFTGDWNGGLNAWLRYDSDRHSGSYDKDLLGGRFFTDQATRVNANRPIPGVAEGQPVIESGIDHILVTQDGQFILVASQSGSFEWWGVRGIKKIAEIQAHRGLIYHIEFSPDEKSVVSLGRDGKIKIVPLPVRIPATPGPDGLPVVSVFGTLGEQNCTGCRTFFIKGQKSDSIDVVAADRDGKLLTLAIAQPKEQINEPVHIQ